MVATITSGSSAPFELLVSASLAGDTAPFFSDDLPAEHTSVGAPTALPGAPAVLTLSRQSSVPHAHCDLPSPACIPAVEGEEPGEEFEGEAVQEVVAAELETPRCGPDQQPDDARDVTSPPPTPCLARALSFGDPGTPSTPSAVVGAGDSAESCRSPMPFWRAPAHDLLSMLVQHLPALLQAQLSLSRGPFVSSVLEVRV